LPDKHAICKSITNVCHKLINKQFTLVTNKLKLILISYINCLANA
jgi:hypothetical protein